MNIKCFDVRNPKRNLSSTGYRLAVATVSLILVSAAFAANRNSQAVEAQMRSDWRGLKTIATDWSQAEPKLAAPWIYLGIANDRLGETNEAIQAYEQGVTREPNAATAWMYLAADYHKAGLSQKLAQAINKLRTINPTMAMMLQNQYGADLQGTQAANTGSGAPSGLPQKSLAALSRAKQWHSDAQLMMIEINDYANNGQFQIRYSFYSPSDRTGLIVNDNNATPAGAANWGTIPIPAEFIDLPAAVAQARAQGMQGSFNQARLRVGNHGLTWVITSTVETSTTRDPFMRSGAFEIPATTR